MVRIIVFAAILALFSCEKEKNTVEGFGTVTIYTVNDYKTGVLIDGKDYGVLKKAVQMPVCGDPAFKNVQLTEGNHKFTTRYYDYAWDKNKYKIVTVVKDECKQVCVN